MKRIRYRIEALVFGALLAISRLLPLATLRALGSTAGAVGHRLDRRRNRTARENLTLAFGPELSAQEAARILSRCWRHFGRITFEALAFSRISSRNFDRMVRYEGLEHIRAAYAAGKGVVLFSGHFGHWELVALSQGFLGMPLALVTRELDNPYLEKMLAGLRRRSGNVIIRKRRAVRDSIQALGRGLGVAIVIDQDARSSGVFVPFLGRLASTTPMPALLALRTGAPLVPVFSVPENDGVYRVVYEPAVPVRTTGNRADDVRRLTAECTAVLERWVRRHPELWLWMHRRFKTVPPDGEGHETRHASPSHLHGS